MALSDVPNASRRRSRGSKVVEGNTPVQRLEKTGGCLAALRLAKATRRASYLYPPSRTRSSRTGSCADNFPILYIHTRPRACGAPPAGRGQTWAPVESFGRKNGPTAWLSRSVRKARLESGSPRRRRRDARLHHAVEPDRAGRPDAEVEPGPAARGE